MRNFASVTYSTICKYVCSNVFWTVVIFLAATLNLYAQKELTFSAYMDDEHMSLNKDEFVEQIAVDRISGEEEDIYMVGLTYSPSSELSFQYCDSMKKLGNGDAFLSKYKYNPKTGDLTMKWRGSPKYSGTPGTFKESKKKDRYDWAYCVTVDHDGANTYVYVAGASLASTQNMFCQDCNTSQGFQPFPADDFEGFIAKYDASDGSMLAYTYLGGVKGKDEVLDIAIRPGADHDVYVVGYTESPNLSLRAVSSYDKRLNDNGDGFIAGFDKCLTQLKYFTYYSIDSSKSTDGQDRCHGLVFNANGNEMYVSGTTDGSAIGIATRGVYQNLLGGGSDAFAGKWIWKNSSFKPKWGTYIGGDSLDRGRKIAISDPQITGETYVYVTGWALSKNLKIVPGTTVIQKKSGGDNDVFIVKLDGSSGAGIWATYFGGSNGDISNGLNWFYSKKNGTQWLALAGITSSSDNNSFINLYHGTDKLKSNLSNTHDAFFATFYDKGNAVELNYATYLGGSGDETFAPADCSPTCTCLFNSSFSGYGPSISTLSNGAATAYVSFSTNSNDVPSSLLNGNAKGTFYNADNVMLCPSCSTCTHDNYDAFFVRINMCDEDCESSRSLSYQNPAMDIYAAPKFDLQQYQ